MLSIALKIRRYSSAETLSKPLIWLCKNERAESLFNSSKATFFVRYQGDGGRVPGFRSQLLPDFVQVSYFLSDWVSTTTCSLEIPFNSQIVFRYLWWQMHMNLVIQHVTLFLCTVWMSEVLKRFWRRSNPGLAWHNSHGSLWKWVFFPFRLLLISCPHDPIAIKVWNSASSLWSMLSVTITGPPPTPPCSQISLCFLLTW